MIYKTKVFAYLTKKETLSDNDLINGKEKLALKELAKEFLAFNQTELNQLVEDGELIEVVNYE